MRLVLVFGALAWFVFGQAAFALDLEFVAESGEYQAATEAYREIWREDGARIIETLNEVTGTTLRETQIRVIVREGISRSGAEDRPMRLRASYPVATKRATLVHELAHRYLLEVDSDTDYSDVHFPLSLALFQVWSKIWGKDFAQEQAHVEAKRLPRYRKAWDWVLSMSKDERNERWKAYLEGSRARSKPRS